jgi:hypothetical protein
MRPSTLVGRQVVGPPHRLVRREQEVAAVEYPRDPQHHVPGRLALVVEQVALHRLDDAVVEPGVPQDQLLAQRAEPEHHAALEPRAHVLCDRRAGLEAVAEHRLTGTSAHGARVPGSLRRG